MTYRLTHNPAGFLSTEPVNIPAFGGGTGLASPVVWSETYSLWTEPTLTTALEDHALLATLSTTSRPHSQATASTLVYVQTPCLTNLWSSPVVESFLLCASLSALLHCCLPVHSPPDQRSLDRRRSGSPARLAYGDGRCSTLLVDPGVSFQSLVTSADPCARILNVVRYGERDAKALLSKKMLNHRWSSNLLPSLLGTSIVA